MNSRGANYATAKLLADKLPHMQTPTQQTDLAWLTVAVVAAGLLLAVWQVLHPRLLIAGFDLNHAMDAAGAEVPSEIESFYFFVPESGRARSTEIAELSTLLAQAAAEQDYIGVAGADVERNREEFLEALENTTAGLNGATVVYLGPEAHRAELQAAVDSAGGTLRFVLYPPLPANAI